MAGNHPLVALVVLVSAKPVVLVSTKLVMLASTKPAFGTQ